MLLPDYIPDHCRQSLMVTGDLIKTTLKTEAFALGFVLCGITTTTPPESFPRFETWLSHEFFGDMHYMARSDTIQKRANPQLLMPEAQSLVSLAYPYPFVYSTNNDPPEVSIAAYAKIPDYHVMVPILLDQLMTVVMKQFEIPIRWRIFTDSAPILEHDLARRAGLGWIGRNSLLLNPKYGSNFLLAEVFLDIPLEPDSPFEHDFCGTCRKCIEQCPTHCIKEDRTIDASRCISYLTIEKKGAIPEQCLPDIDYHFFGCDICQQVCPWNSKALINLSPEAGIKITYPENLKQLIDLLFLDETQVAEKFQGTTFTRLKRSNLLRNACVVLGNSKSSESLKALNEFIVKETDPVLQKTAQWAIANLKKHCS